MRFPAGRWEPGPAFLHRRVTSKGDERLIAVEVGDSGDDLHFYCRNFEPMSLFADGDWSRGPRTIRGQYVIRRAMTEPVRLYAGQSDANDPSAFDIRCESGTNSATIHGRVQADGTVVLDTTASWLQARFGPPAPSRIETFSPRNMPTRQKPFSEPPPLNY
jgi:hypothetical protein